MRKRFVDIIRSALPARCAVALLLSAGVLFGSLSDIHAQTGGRPASPFGCSASERANWTDSEKWAWKQICEGRNADFNKRRGNERLDPKNLKHDSKWENRRRTLSSSFLKTILLNERFRSAIPHRGVRIFGAYFEEGIDLSDASVERPLALADSLFKSSIDMSRFTTTKFVSFTGSRYRGKLNMDSASIGSDLFMRNAQFDKPTNLAFLSVGFYLDLRGAVLRGLDLTSARIERGLWLGPLVGGKNIEWKSYEDENRRSHNPKLTLRNTSVGTLQDIKDAWPDDLELDGFTYKRFVSGEKETLYERGSEWFVNWLEKDKSYSPQPYLHLAGVLRTAELNSIADDVLYANREREREGSGWGWWSFLTVIWLVFGYGYGLKSLWTLLWAGVFVVLGTAFLVIYEERHKKGERHKKEALGFGYSLDMLLPVIHLREEHYKVDLENKWVRRYFYIHKIIGYVLTSFLLAGLSGLTKYLTE